VRRLARAVRVEVHDQGVEVLEAEAGADVKGVLHFEPLEEQALDKRPLVEGFAVLAPVRRAVLDSVGSDRGEVCEGGFDPRGDGRKLSVQARPDSMGPNSDSTSASVRPLLRVIGLAARSAVMLLLYRQQKGPPRSPGEGL
jgi:hypothetical protein